MKIIIYKLLSASVELCALVHAFGKLKARILEIVSFSYTQLFSSIWRYSMECQVSFTLKVAACVPDRTKAATMADDIIWKACTTVHTDYITQAPFAIVTWPKHNILLTRKARMTYPLNAFQCAKRVPLTRLVCCMLSMNVEQVSLGWPFLLWLIQSDHLM